MILLILDQNEKERMCIQYRHFSILSLTLHQLV